MGSNSSFDGVSLGGFNGNRLACFGFGGFEKRSGLGKSVPLVTCRTLAGPFGKFVTATITKKDSGGLGHFFLIIRKNGVEAIISRSEL